MEIKLTVKELAELVAALQVQPINFTDIFSEIPAVKGSITGAKIETIRDDA